MDGQGYFPPLPSLPFYWVTEPNIELQNLPTPHEFSNNATTLSLLVFCLK